MTRSKFELPNQERLSHHYIPERARDEAEIARRRAQAGTHALIHEEEARGIELGSRVLQSIEDPNDRAIFAKTLGSALLGSAGYLFDADEYLRMRHNIDLAKVTDGEKVIETPETFELKVYEDLAEAARISTVLADLRRERKPVGRLPIRAAQLAGRAGLNLAIYPLHGFATDSNPKSVMESVFESSVDMSNNAIRLTGETGYIPTPAQLVSYKTPLGIHILRTAPTEVTDRFEEALEIRSAA